MAAYGPARDRVAYLLGLSDHRQSTPATMSGGPDRLYSYRMQIAFKLDDGSYLVHKPTSTPTTNRHIRALVMELQSRGFDAVGEGLAGYVRFIR